MRRAVLFAIAFGLGATVGCARTRKTTRSPEACMSECEQSRCNYKPEAQGDQEAYFDCLEACAARCDR